jgi:predicted AAA+ superfamily ATPase
MKDLENYINLKKNLKRLNQISKNEKSILIIGSARSGKTTALKQLLIHSSRALVLFPAYHQYEAKELETYSNAELFLHSKKFDFTETQKNQFKDKFNQALEKNVDIFLDECKDFDFIKELIETYFMKDKKNKLVVTLQSLSDIVDKNIIKKFDLILHGRNMILENLNFLETELKFSKKEISSLRKLEEGQFILKRGDLND